MIFFLKRTLLLGMVVGLGWPQVLWGNSLFNEMVQEFAEQTIKEFVGYVSQNERYPLLHVITRTRLTIFRAYLGIRKPSDTQVCSKRRNSGTTVPDNQQTFCQQYDQTIEAAKAGLVDAGTFEKVYFQLEPFLLREIEKQQAREAMRRWIQRKFQCFEEKTRCGKDERGMITRVTHWKPDILQLYQRLLSDLEKKLFPEESTITTFENVIESPCVNADETGEMIVEQGMVFVPEGTFLMGNDLADEKNAPSVSLDAYWIDRCEVTNFQFLKYLASDPSLRKSTFQRKFHDGNYLKNWINDLQPPITRDNYPVTYVSWFAARYYCQSIGKRLPSEAEWERASLAGEKATFFHESELQLENHAWFIENSEGRIHLVASKLPNKFQLFDMQGNVWEWVYDWYAPYPAETLENPQGPPMGKYRVIRGGSWKSPAAYLQPTMRGEDSPFKTSSDIGFRCAADQPPNLTP